MKLCPKGGKTFAPVFGVGEFDSVALIKFVDFSALLILHSIFYESGGNGPVSVSLIPFHSNFVSLKSSFPTRTLRILYFVCLSRSILPSPFESSTYLSIDSSKFEKRESINSNTSYVDYFFVIKFIILVNVYCRYFSSISIVLR